MTIKKQITKEAKLLRKELGLDFVFAIKVAKTRLGYGTLFMFDLYDEIEKQSNQQIKVDMWYSVFDEEWNTERYIIGKSGKKIYL